MTKDKIIQIAMDCNSMMVLEMREMDAKDEFLLEFAAAIRAATKEEDARICEAESADMLRTGEGCRDGSYDRMAQGADSCADAIRASK